MDQIIIAGLKVSWRMAQNVMPMLILGFILAGLASVMIPKGFVAEWMGKESGLKGIGIGWGLGVLMPGVTSTVFPLIALLLEQKCGIAPLITFLSAWGLCQLQRLITWEIGSFGLELTLVRFAVCLFIPPVIGLTVGWWYER